MRILAGMNDGLAMAMRQNGRWRLETRLDGLRTECLAFDPLRPEHVYCGTTRDGLWRSDDGGTTWHPAGEGIPHRAITAVAVSPTERHQGSGVVYAGTEPSELYRSEDGGATWRECAALRAIPSRPTWSFPPRPGTHHVRWIEPDPVVAGRVYVSIEQGGVMRTLDGGQTFEDRRPDGPRDAHTLATHEAAPGLLYAAAADGLGAPGREFAVSRDGGTTWHREGGGIAHHYLWSVAVDPGNAERVVVSGAHTPSQAHDSAHAESALYYRDAGGRWERAVEGLPPADGTVIPVLATSHAEPGVFYAACNWGIFRSADAGRTWQALAIEWPAARYGRQHVQGLAVLPL